MAMGIQAKVVSAKELLDQEENPALCLSALRVFDDCINCEAFKRAMKKYGDINATVEKLRCKPRVSERVKDLVAQKEKLRRELEAVNEAIKDPSKKIAPMVGGAEMKGLRVMDIDGLHVKLVHIADGVPAWEDNKEQKHRGYTVVIQNEKGETATFDFWGSAADYDAGKDATAQDALACVLSDAITGADYDDIDEFNREFGYTKPSEAIRAFEGCREAYKKIKALGLSREKIGELYEKLEK